MEDNVSKTTIGVLLILVVLISVIGTWVVLSAITGINLYTPAPKVEKKSTAGLAVLDHAPSSNSQATVTLTVLPQKEVLENV